MCFKTAESGRVPEGRGSHVKGPLAFSDEYGGWKEAQRLRTAGSWMECFGGVGQTKCWGASE